MERTRHLVAALVAATLVAAAPAAATDGKPDGIWGAFTRCPLAEPKIADPDNEHVTCVAARTPRNNDGLFKVRGTSIKLTGATDIQFGFDDTPGVPDPDGGIGALHRDVVSPPGSVQAEPIAVPGGLIGLAGEQAVAQLIAPLPLIPPIVNAINGVTAVVEQAGPIKDVLFLNIIEGEPVMTLPVKIRLQNALLGPACYIGSDANPIVLKPQTGQTSPPPPNQPIKGHVPTPINLVWEMDEDAPASVSILGIERTTVVDNSFAIPVGASGCGPLGVLNSAIDSRLGLPAPAGQNTFVLPGLDAFVATAFKAPEKSAAQVLADEIKEG